jgi:hypothetical protein
MEGQNTQCALAGFMQNSGTRRDTTRIVAHMIVRDRSELSRKQENDGATRYRSAPFASARGGKIRLTAQSSLPAPYPPGSSNSHGSLSVTLKTIDTINMSDNNCSPAVL